MGENGLFYGRRTGGISEVRLYILSVRIKGLAIKIFRLLLLCSCFSPNLLYTRRIKNLNESVIENIRDNCVNGHLFLQMSESDLKEVASLLCDRIILRNLQRSEQVKVVN